jgi:hypothetical protein
MLMPSLGIVQAYDGETAEYHNAFAFYQLSRSLIHSIYRWYGLTFQSQFGVY